MATARIADQAPTVGGLGEAPAYQRHRPETTLHCQLVEQHYPVFRDHLAAQGRPSPQYVQREFEDFLQCGRLENGFLRVRCEQCHHERLVAFSCKRRGFCPSCGARRMVDSAALLVDAVLPRVALRQWVLSVPFPLHFLFASHPQVMGKALGIVYRCIATHLIHKAGLSHPSAKTGAVTFIQRFGSALNLNVHFHMLFLDGVYVVDTESASPLPLLQQHSITYRVAVGPQQGRKVFTLQTLPPRTNAPQPRGRNRRL